MNDAYEQAVSFDVYGFCTTATHRVATLSLRFVWQGLISACGYYVQLYQL